jgi:hypothetical protein
MEYSVNSLGLYLQVHMFKKEGSLRDAIKFSLA